MNKWPKTDEERAALKKGTCPTCGGGFVDMRGSNQSQMTLRARGTCSGDGMTWECNKDIREQREKASKWT